MKNLRLIEEIEIANKENNDLKQKIEVLKNENFKHKNDKKLEQVKLKMSYSKELDELIFKINS